MSNLWALIQTIRQAISALGVLLGLIERVKYEHAIGEIDKDTKTAADPNATEEQRNEATKSLEDRFNKHV